jgi:hypothetical protein
LFVLAACHVDHRRAATRCLQTAAQVDTGNGVQINIQQVAGANRIGLSQKLFGAAKHDNVQPMRVQKTPDAFAHRDVVFYNYNRVISASHTCSELASRSVKQDLPFLFRVSPAIFKARPESSQNKTLRRAWPAVCIA